MVIETKSMIVHEPPTKTWRSQEPRFRIPGVAYRGEQKDYLLFEKTIPEMEQEGLIEFYEQEKQKGNPVPADAPLIWAISTRAYELRGENPKVAEKLRKFLEKNFERHINTLTRINYSPQNDVIIHNIGTSDQYSLERNVVGPDGWISKISDTSVLESLLGTDDVNKINEVSRWINGADFYIWRLNSKPKQPNKRVVGFSYLLREFRLVLHHLPFVALPAFRVLQAD